MPYMIRVQHPDADAHRNPKPDGFDPFFNEWAAVHAPQVPSNHLKVAQLMKYAPTRQIFDILNDGGELEPVQVASLDAALSRTDLHDMDEVKAIRFAAERGYPVRVDWEYGVAGLKGDLEVSWRPVDTGPASPAEVEAGVRKFKKGEITFDELKALTTGVKFEAAGRSEWGDYGTEDTFNDRVGAHVGGVLSAVMVDELAQLAIIPPRR